MNQKNSESTPICRWGILGASTIARKNWLAILNSNNGTLVAVASRDQNRAEAFIENCQQQHPFPQRPISIGGYDELLANPAIDAVYIPLPTGVRKEWIIKAAQAGKHVLCEKPCAVSVSDLKDIIRVCQERQVQLMDGVMFMHSQRLIALKEAIKDESHFGSLRRITSQFSFDGGEEFQSQSDRLDSQLEPFGALGDLGWYDIRTSLWVMDFQLPVEIRGRILRKGKSEKGDKSVPIEFAGELRYASGVEASFYCSFVSALSQWLHLTGTLGEIRVDDYVLPVSNQPPGFTRRSLNFDNSTCQFRMQAIEERVETSEPADSRPGSQESRMFQNFGKLVVANELDPFWPEISLKTQQVMEALVVSAENQVSMVLSDHGYVPQPTTK